MEMKMAAKNGHKELKKSRLFRVGWDYIKSLAAALVLALIIKTSVVEAYVIPTGSMENTLLPGDYILGNKFVYGMKLPFPFTDINLPSLQEPKPGDIVIFKYPNDPSQYYIKRCVAVGGQTVEIRNKNVYVDGELVPLPREGKHSDNRTFPPQNPAQWGINIRDNMPPVRVPDGKLFMMGDNRDNSADSRFWGFLDRDLVLARALVVLWSWKYDDALPMANGGLSNIDLWSYNIRHLPQLVLNLRWDRFGKITN
jgi:signal peptidase I